MKKNYKIHTRGAIISGIVLIILSIVVILAAAFIKIEKIEKINVNIQKIDSLTNEISGLKANFNRIRALSLSQMIERNQEDFKSASLDITEKQTSMEKQLISLEYSLESCPEIQKLLLSIKPLVTKYFRDREIYENYLKTDNIEEAYILSKTSLNTYYQELREGIKVIEDQLMVKKGELITTYKSIRSSIASNSLIFGIIVIFIIIIASFALLKMLNNITTEIKNGIFVLAASSEDILSTITEMSTSASETAASVAETTATIEEVRQTAAVANDRAKSLLESTGRVKTSAEKGQNSLNMMTNGMDQIDIQMKKISSTVIKLSEQNRRVGEITSSVADIADQSNLLAVNAAIEAAKAGEHGRGFTVVAQEIRNLSDQSKRATQQVKEILNEIEKSVNETVGVTEESKKIVDTGKKLTIQSGEIIDILAENIEETANAAMQISSSNHQQMAGMDQIVPAMENIKKASELNLSGIRQTQNATSEVNKLGKSLKKILLKFNL